MAKVTGTKRNRGPSRGKSRPSTGSSPSFTSRSNPRRAKPESATSSQAPRPTSSRGTAMRVKRTSADANTFRKEDTYLDDIRDQLDHIEGRHPVIEAFKANRPITTLYLQKGGEGDAFSALQRLAGESGVPVKWVNRDDLDRMSQTRQHQGVIAIALAKELSSIEDLLEIAASRKEMPFIVVLDGLEDPQNVGSLLRSAEAAGCHGVIMRTRRAASITPSLLKASAGAWEHIAVAQVVNIARAVDELKKAGVWVVGAEGGAPQAYDTDLNRPIALVIGSEGEGISQLVKKSCDLLVSLPMNGKISSLNAAVAGGALLYEIVRQRRV